MHIRIFILSLMLFSLGSFAQETIQWGTIASIDTAKITKEAESYLSEKAKELKGFNLKVLEINASYRNGGKGLFASFFHKKSYVEGSDEIIRVQTKDGEMDHPFIAFDIVIVEFDSAGVPKSYQIISKKYPGTVQDFQKQFKDQHGEH